MAQARKKPGSTSARKPERLFDPDPVRCRYCSALDPADCQHDFERRQGYRGARPKSCLNHYDPSTARIPY